MENQLQYLLQQRNSDKDWITDDLTHNNHFNNNNEHFFHIDKVPINSYTNIHMDRNDNKFSVLESKHETSFQSKKSTGTAFNHAELRKIHKKRPDSYKYVSPFVLSAEKRAQMRIRNDRKKFHKDSQPTNRNEWTVDIKATSGGGLFDPKLQKQEIFRSRPRVVNTAKPLHDDKQQDPHLYHVNQTHTDAPPKTSPTRLTQRTNKDSPSNVPHALRRPAPVQQPPQHRRHQAEDAVLTANDVQSGGAAQNRFGSFDDTARPPPHFNSPQRDNRSGNSVRNFESPSFRTAHLQHQHESGGSYNAQAPQQQHPIQHVSIGTDPVLSSPSRHSPSYTGFTNITDVHDRVSGAERTGQRHTRSTSPIDEAELDRLAEELAHSDADHVVANRNEISVHEPLDIPTFHPRSGHSEVISGGQSQPLSSPRKCVGPQSLDHIISQLKHHFSQPLSLLLGTPASKGKSLAEVTSGHHSRVVHSAATPHTDVSGPVDSNAQLVAGMAHLMTAVGDLISSNSQKRSRGRNRAVEFAGIDGYEGVAVRRDRRSRSHSEYQRRRHDYNEEEIDSRAYQQQRQLFPSPSAVKNRNVAFDLAGQPVRTFDNIRPNFLVEREKQLQRSGAGGQSRSVMMDTILQKLQAIDQTERDTHAFLVRSNNQDRDHRRKYGLKVPYGEQVASLGAHLDLNVTSAAVSHAPDSATAVTQLPRGASSHGVEMQERLRLLKKKATVASQYRTRASHNPSSDLVMEFSHEGDRKVELRAGYQSGDSSEGELDKRDHARHTHRKDDLLRLRAPGPLDTHDNAITNHMDQLAIDTADDQLDHGGSRNPGKLDIHVNKLGKRVNILHTDAPPSQQRLNLMALLGVSTHLSRERTKDQRRREVARDKEISYLKQFPTLRDDVHNNRDVHQFMKDLDMARKMKDVAFNARGVSMAMVADKAAEAVYSDLVRAVAGEVLEGIGELSEKLVDKL